MNPSDTPGPRAAANKHTATGHSATGTAPLPAPDSGWQRVCRIDDIPLLGARRVARAQGMDVALFRSAQEQVFALLDRCPHKGGPLSQGLVFGQQVACPLHNLNLDLASGCALPPDQGCTPRFAVLLQDGCVHLRTQELAEHALTAVAPVAGPATRGPASVPVVSSVTAPVTAPPSAPVATPATPAAPLGPAPLAPSP